MIESNKGVILLVLATVIQSYWLLLQPALSVEWDFLSLRRVLLALSEAKLG